jgi:DNA-binding NarL/FixJ family response regulator
MVGHQRRSPRRLVGDDLLDGRERDVLNASTRGATLREVADELALAEAEVRAALRSAMDKLGAGSKLEAVVVALRRGDLDP